MTSWVPENQSVGLAKPGLEHLSLLSVEVPFNEQRCGRRIHQPKQQAHHCLDPLDAASVGKQVGPQNAMCLMRHEVQVVTGHMQQLEPFSVLQVAVLHHV